MNRNIRKITNKKYSDNYQQKSRDNGNYKNLKIKLKINLGDIWKKRYFVHHNLYEIWKSAKSKLKQQKRHRFMEIIKNNKNNEIL